MKSERRIANARGFFHSGRFESPYKRAMAFVGEGTGGRVATLPDIIEARLTAELGDPAWEQYFATMTAEYVGRSRQGNPIAIVAHGVGPMADLAGIQGAYGFEFNDKSSANEGGRISVVEFRKLEAGHYGDVNIIDLSALWARTPYLFNGHSVTMREIENEPLWQARLGKKWREYVERHTAFAQKWDVGHHRTPYQNPCILEMRVTISYGSGEEFDRATHDSDNAIAHLLSIGRLMNGHCHYFPQDGDTPESRISLTSSIGCHSGSAGKRLLGIRPGGTIVIGS